MRWRFPPNRDTIFLLCLIAGSLRYVAGGLNYLRYAHRLTPIVAMLLSVASVVGISVLVIVALRAVGRAMTPR